jgi:actin-related protein
MIASKAAVGEDLPAQYEVKKNLPEVTATFKAYMQREVIRDFQVFVTWVNDKYSFDADTLASFPTAHYCFPNGFNANYGLERYSIPEAFFDPEHHMFKKDSVPPSTSYRYLAGHHSLVRKAISLCDADVQMSLWTNVVLGGANTLHNGYSDRLYNELTRIAPPGNKYKIISSSSSQERMFSSWIGGSILGSLGSFQQMWFSKAEYGESGKAYIEKKCP